METAIFYYSNHHGNTKKVLDAIRERYPVQLYNVEGKESMDLSRFSRIGFASGIYYGGASKELVKFMENNLPEGKDVFFILTGGNPKDSNFASLRGVARKKGCRELGNYMCKGYDTYGPFALVGGIAKEHPTQEDLDNAVKFYGGLIGNGPDLR
jgi:flavodoxin